MGIELQDLPENITRIVELEKGLGHNGFLHEMNSVSEAVEKYDFIIEILQSIEEKKNDQIEILQGMLQTGILTPETTAYILVNECTSCNYVQSVIESILQQKSTGDLIVFCELLYRLKEEQLRIVLKKKLQMIRDYCFINDQFERRYEKNDDKNQWFTGRCAVYTVITGDYDKLWDPTVINPNWDYYLFTDAPEKFDSKIWKIVPIDNPEGLSPVLLQRKVKIMPYVFLADYDYTIYVDGKLRIDGDLQKYIDIYAKKCSMLCIPHPSRQKLEEEAEAIILLNKSTSEKILKQIGHYRKEGYSDQRIMPETCLLVRSNRDERLIKTMRDWWEEILRWTHRDQLSIGYCCWKNDYDYDISMVYLLQNHFFTVNEHV